MIPVYCVREDVKQALDVLETARTNTEIDRQIAAASRAIDGADERRGGGRLHRVFFPEQGSRSFDWPNIQVAKPWRLWLDQHDLITLTGVVSGGVTIPVDTVKLYPDYGPPYRWLELDVSSNSAFFAGSTWQQSITVTGLWGYRDDTAPAGTLPANLDATAATFGLGVPGYRGVGSLLRIDNERMIITDRSMAATGQALTGANLTAQNSSQIVGVADTTLFAVGETILIDAETMRIRDIGAGLIVDRAYNGSTLAAHTAGAAIYALRTVTVARGQCGTTAAAHTAGAAVSEWTPPELIRQLTVAQAEVNLLQTKAGYPTPVRTGTSVSSATAAVGARPPTRPSDLTDLWDQACTAHGRNARVRTV